MRVLGKADNPISFLWSSFSCFVSLSWVCIPHCLLRTYLRQAPLAQTDSKSLQYLCLGQTERKWQPGRFPSLGAYTALDTQQALANICPASTVSTVHPAIGRVTIYLLNQRILCLWNSCLIMDLVYALLFFLFGQYSYRKVHLPYTLTNNYKVDTDKTMAQV